MLIIPISEEGIGVPFGVGSAGSAQTVDIVFNGHGKVVVDDVFNIFDIFAGLLDV